MKTIITLLLSCILCTPSAKNQSFAFGKAVIEGSIIYPSSAIPADMVLHAENLEGEVQSFKLMKKAKANEFVNELEFKIRLKPNKYYLYLTSDYEEVKGYKAYYTEFVKCGMKKECKSHKPILFNLERWDRINNIKLGDWYAN
jgi:hypothetical protein